MSLKARIPGAAVLLSLEPEEAASQLLQVLGPQILRSWPGNSMANRDDISRLTGEYPQQRQAEVELAITEAWRWLELNLFIVPASGTNGSNGWFVLGRRGRKALEHPEQFTSYAKAAAFNRDLLHPLIAETQARDPCARTRTPSPSGKHSPTCSPERSGRTRTHTRTGQ